jgi:hypothetical protein
MPKSFCLILPGIDNDREQGVTASLVKFAIRPCGEITRLAKCARFADKGKKNPHNAANERGVSSPTLYASYILLQRIIGAECFGLDSGARVLWELAGILHLSPIVVR